MAKNSLRDLYIDELRDLYSAETQLVKALPKMAKNSANGQLREAFEEHLRQTSEHVSRLEQIFHLLQEKPTGKKCLGMEGLVKEGAEILKGEFANALKDAGIIGAARQVEHYEIAAYDLARTFAGLLGETGHASLLEQTLEEETRTDDLLSQIAAQVNDDAARNGNGEEIKGEKSKHEEVKHEGSKEKTGSRQAA
ncbi:MAG TPA: ferritin-like domain-containing protein [Candidatus Binatia bacterium]|nr:ferritin-like domain-containing protein [Candidatus Binatia bacterium]